jgi:hypothetical protein
VIQRITPYVEDRMNGLLVHVPGGLDAAGVVTLRYALKRGIETVFQLESSELGVEALPERDAPKVILFYEAAEGGAGVLARLVSDRGAVHAMARCVLEACHYGSTSGKWRDADDLENRDTDREAGCYKCLLSYTNQPHHKAIERRHVEVLDLLCRLSRCELERGADGQSRGTLFELLENLSVSTLERAWLD